MPPWAQSPSAVAMQDQSLHSQLAARPHACLLSGGHGGQLNRAGMEQGELTGNVAWEFYYFTVCINTRWGWEIRG